MYVIMGFQNKSVYEAIEVQ